MADRFNVAREVRTSLGASTQYALEVLPALAGEILASGDAVSVSELKDALGFYVFEQGPNHDVAEAVLTMVRTWTIGQAAKFNH